MTKVSVYKLNLFDIEFFLDIDSDYTIIQNNDKCVVTGNFLTLGIDCSQILNKKDLDYKIEIVKFNNSFENKLME